VSGAIPVRAAVFPAPGAPPSIEEALLDPPEAGEVLVRVAAAGVCHSDLHLADGHLGERRFPTVLGHEGAGVVEAVGEGVTRVAPGDPVAFCFVPACGECRACRSGRENLCEPGNASSARGTLPGGDRRLHLADGATLKHFLGIACFAERCVVAEAACVPVPPELPLWQAALVGCAVVTGFGAVRNAARVRAGESACVVGCGGVGLQVIAAASQAGASPIVAVDRLPAKLELARTLGATHAVEAGEGAVEAVRELTDGGADHAFEVVGTPATIRLAWDVLRPGGTAVVVGLAPIGVEAAVPAIDFLSEKSLRGCFYGAGNPAAEIASLAQQAASGGLPLGETVSRFAPLEEVGEALERLRRGEGARTVLLVDSDLAGAQATD
jgi:S-(hydroxymethyl)glutathione dehydrogenase/alcohol dehydrogenase